MAGKLEKYKKLLFALKEKRAREVDLNTDAENRYIDNRIRKVAEFCSNYYCKCKTPLLYSTESRLESSCGTCYKEIKTQHNGN